MVEQLAAVAGETIAGASTPAGRDRERRRLLDLAAARIGDRGGRLLLVIDGLDEDEGQLNSSKPSIASLLPTRLPESVRVLVFSRSSPGVPDDVPIDHPLRHCAVRTLAPSSGAQEIRLRARQELLDHLRGNPLEIDVIGFITAAGGGLTLGELGELIQQPRFRLRATLTSVFGRSLQTTFPADRPHEDDAERVYMFAHETLQVIAEQELAHDLGSYRQRIDAWADGYHLSGWPPSTPRYLLRPYGRLLATSGDLQRLVTLATDPARHDRMLAYTEGDTASLAEVTTTQQLILAEALPDLVALGCLAVHRDRLTNRNEAMPPELPALWARLGQIDRGEAIARSTTNPDAQAEALGAVAEALAGAGQWDRAEQVARSVASRGVRAWALGTVAAALAEADRDRALSLAAEAEWRPRRRHQSRRTGPGIACSCRGPGRCGAMETRRAGRM